MNPDDKAFFLDAMSDVKPLKSNQHTQWQPATKPSFDKRVYYQEDENFLTTGFLDVIPLSEPLEYQQEGLQQGVVEKLRNGKYQQQASLNLLRMPVAQCRKQVFEFIVQAERAGLRNLLIIHGKGREDRSHANVIRSFLARWLTEFESVQAFCRAADNQGGSGACYVVLRKSQVAKEETWERHAKRSR